MALKQLHYGVLLVHYNQTSDFYRQTLPHVLFQKYGVNMLLFSSAKPILNFTTLDQISNPLLFQKYLNAIATWFTDEWGYLYDKNKTRTQAIEERQHELLDCTAHIHLAFYHQQLVGAFRIEDKPFTEALLTRPGQDMRHAKELWFIYVDSAYRTLGVGRQMLQQIKRLSQQMQVDTLLLETLKPSLNGFYKKQNAQWILEHRLVGHPTDMLKITVR